MGLRQTVGRWVDLAVEWLLVRGLGAPEEVTVLLGDLPREGSPYVRIEARGLWAAEPIKRRLVAVLRGRWVPSDALIRAYGKAVFGEEYFGSTANCGVHLALINQWHLSREWKLEHLTPHDRQRAQSLGALGVMTRLRFRGIPGDDLTLRLADRVPFIPALLYPMVAKMPVLSAQHFLELHVVFAFNAIREAHHPEADAIISYLYEVLFLQQKTAICVLTLATRATQTLAQKGTLALIDAEVDAIVAADTAFAYLKASVEKTIALLGAAHGVQGLANLKEHKKRVGALRRALPAGVEKLPYAEFMFEMVASENLEDLNAYRTGLLHKMGIAELQPHSFVGKSSDDLPIGRVLSVVLEQHRRNTALLIVALALLTDRLAELSPPPFTRDELPSCYLNQEIEVNLTNAIDSAGPSDGVTRARLLYARGIVHRHAGRSREAIGDFEEALAAGSDSPADVYNEIGLATLDLDDVGKDQRAVDAFTRVIAHAPRDHRGYVGRALSYENLGDLKAATADIDVAIPLATHSALLLEKRGVWRLTAGRHAEALADFDAALAQGHVSSDLLTGRGTAKRELGELDEALAILTDAVERFPTAVMPRLQRSLLLFMTNRMDAAAPDLEWVIENKADHYQANLAFGLRSVIRREAGDNDGALSDLSEAQSRTKGDASGEFAALARALSADGQRLPTPSGSSE